MYLPREILMGQTYQLQHAMAADYKTCLIFDFFSMWSPEGFHLL